MPTISPISIAVHVRDEGERRVDVVPVWRGRFVAVTPPAGADGAKPQRGCWTLTHIATGMAVVGRLPISKRDAISLARAWDERIGLIDPAATRSWPHCDEWGAVIRGIREPWSVGTDPADSSTATALGLAIGRRLSVRGGGAASIRWRGKWWPAPTDAELNAWTMDSCCETPDGRTVEPDAPDSWLRILGLV